VLSKEGDDVISFEGNEAFAMWTLRIWSLIANDSGEG
jgi:hypothetical protein